MHIIHISDTHNTYPDIPECDLLIHSGDLTNMGTIDEVKDGLDWLSKQPASAIIYVPGNHDMCLDSDHMYGMSYQNAEALKQEYAHKITIETCNTFTYTLEGFPSIDFGVCSYQPFFGGWGFNVSSKLERKEFYKKALLNKPDILITHAPPYGVLDKNHYGESCGDMVLTEIIFSLYKDGDKLPKYLFCGHIHQSAGFEERYGIKCYNSATKITELYIDPSEFIK